MILFNGASGGLGRHMAVAVDAAGLAGHAIRARLGDRAGLLAELEGLPPLVRADGAAAVGEPTAAAEPSVWIHLAARVSVPACEQDPRAAHETNVTWAAAAVDAFIAWASARALPARVVFVSTGHVYAAAPRGVRVAEDAPLGPRSVYARTKLAGEVAVAEVAASRGAPLSIARVFGLVGPGQPPGYLLPGLMSRVARGNLQNIPGLDFARDYLDARDVCRHLVTLARGGGAAASVVNVCSGEPTTVADLLAVVLEAMAARGRVPDAISPITGAPGRKDDVEWIVGDPGRLRACSTEPLRLLSLARTVADAVAAA